MPETCQAWSATGRTPDARSVGNFSLNVTGISSRATISLLRVAAHLVAPAFPDGGIPRFGDRLQPIPLFRSCVPIQICLCSTPKKATPFLGSRGEDTCGALSARNVLHNVACQLLQFIHCCLCSRR